MSSPERTQIFYARMYDAVEASKGKALVLKGLTTAGQIAKPWGIAVDNARAALYVADTASNGIVGMRMAIREEDDGDALVLEGTPKAVFTGVSTKWVTVDSVGNLFFTDENTNQIMSISGNALAEALKTGTTVDKATAIYKSDSTPNVKTPQGIAADNLMVYWGNGEGGADAGSVVSANEVPPDDGGSVAVMNSGLDAVQGVCMSGKYLFFSTPEMSVYAMQQKGGEMVQVTAKLQKPRGCSWDNDGTVFVADESGNAVFALPSNMPTLRGVNARKAVKVTGPFDVAVFSAAAQVRLWGFALALAVAALSRWW